MVIFVSGNERKISLYTSFLREHGASFISRSLAIEEIQSDSLEQIVEHKARQAFATLRQPLFVQDAAWSIPSLKGFPGPFIKYMNQWLSSEDFLTLMKNKTDRSVDLIENFGCIDSKGDYSSFSTSFSAHFLDAPVGTGSSVDRITALEGSEKPLSLITPEEWRELFAKSTIWKELATWIKKQES